MLNLSKIPHLELRKKLMAHFEEERRHEKARDEATADLREKIRETEMHIRQTYGKMRDELLHPLTKQMDDLTEPFETASSTRWDALGAEFKAAGIGLSHFDMHDDYTGCSACILTGLPFMENDRKGQDPDGDEFLFDVIDLPLQGDKSAEEAA